MLTALAYTSEIHHFTANGQGEFEFKKEDIKPFDEFIATWNAERPIEGDFAIYVSLKTTEWSPWLLYAHWGSHGQTSYSFKDPRTGIHVFQDTIEVLNCKTANGFRVRVEAPKGVEIRNMHSMHVCTSNSKEWDAAPEEISADLKSICLPAKGKSQMVLVHPRRWDMCSPTSTAIAASYLTGVEIDPIQFSTHVLDHGFDIYGNWVFNVAQAYAQMKNCGPCWVERLSGFMDIYKKLVEDIPVVVSVRGPLKGSPQAYKSGHLMVVIGFDPVSSEVICLDPAFRSDNETQVRYGLQDFMEAWGRRQRIAYIFNR